MFEVKCRDCLSRICNLLLKHGNIETPTLLPVVNPNELLIPPNELKKYGACALITNSYIICKNTNLREKALNVGVHGLLNTTMPIMTDSGAFQQYVYQNIQISNQEIVNFQKTIGSDICTLLDVISLPTNYESAKYAVEETIKRSKEIHDCNNMALPIQGGIFTDLRKYCAKEIIQQEPFLIAIGGVVPLMESYRYEDIVDIIISVKSVIPSSIPVHLFGCGHPMIFPLACALGIDIFDSSAYIKYAKAKRMIFPECTRRLKDMSYLPCNCEICSKYEVSELKQMPENELVKNLAIHNLWISFTEIKRVKTAIKENRIFELIECSAKNHPALYNAVKKLNTYLPYLEKYENLSRNRFFYYPDNVLIPPALYRYKKRLNEIYKPNKDLYVVLQESKKPYLKTYNKISKIYSKNIAFVIKSFVPIPIEFAEIYPVGYSESIPFTNNDEFKKFAEKFSNVIDYSENISLPVSKIDDFDIERLKLVADYQFGASAGNALFEGDVKLVKSKTTNRVRNVYNRNEHILSLGNDGFFKLKYAGGKILYNNFPEPKLRIYVCDESVEYVKKGYNVFAKFVIKADSELRPYDEVIIVDKNDNFINTGKCILNGEEMLAFKVGIAAKVHSSVVRKPL